MVAETAASAIPFEILCNALGGAVSMSGPASVAVTMLAVKWLGIVVVVAIVAVAVCRVVKIMKEGSGKQQN
jgi:hypothetical protein